MVITDVNQVTYNGDGITTAWPFTFPIIDNTDLRLTLINAAGARTDITSDYYVDMVNNTVYYPGYAPGAEPPEANQPPKVQSGEKLEIYRRVPVNQLADLGKNWPFKVIEKGLDKLTMICQDIYSWIGRNIVGLTEDGTSWDARNLPISNVGGPVNVKDAATKDYVDRILSGIIASGDGRIVPFDNVAQMIDADVVAGQIAATLGYYDINDGGAGVYSIRAKTPYDEDDGGSIIFLDNGNVAELIADRTINVKQFGAKGDRVTNDTQYVQNAIDFAQKRLDSFVGSANFIIEFPGVCAVTSLSISNEGDGNVRKKLIFKGTGGGVHSVASSLFVKAEDAPTYVGNMHFVDFVFHSSAGSGHSVILDNDYSFIRISFDRCTFRGIDHLFKSDVFVQSIRVLNSTFILGNSNIISTCAGADIVFDNCIIERRAGGVLKQTVIPDSQFKTINDFIVQNCCIEEFSNTDALFDVVAGDYQVTNNWIETDKYTFNIDLRPPYLTLRLSGNRITGVTTNLARNKISAANMGGATIKANIIMENNSVYLVPLIDLAEFSISDFAFAGEPEPIFRFSGNTMTDGVRTQYHEGSNRVVCYEGLEIVNSLPVIPEGANDIILIDSDKYNYCVYNEWGVSVQRGEAYYIKRVLETVESHQTTTKIITMTEKHPQQFGAYSGEPFLIKQCRVVGTSMAVLVENIKEEDKTEAVFYWYRHKKKTLG